MIASDFPLRVNKLGDELEAGRACKVPTEVTLYLDIQWFLAAVGRGILIGLYNS